jgi:hypothetical protein
MSSLESLTYTVHLKEPDRRADDTIGLTVYLNDQGEDSFCPGFYRKFMASVQGAEDPPTASSASADVLCRRSELFYSTYLVFVILAISDISFLFFLYAIGANRELKKDFNFDGLPVGFGTEWNLLFTPEFFFTQSRFKGNMMGKIKNSFAYSDFLDKMIKAVYSDSDLTGTKFWQVMGTQRQVRNLLFVCCLLTVAIYLKKEKELAAHKHFKTSMAALRQWYQEKKVSRSEGENCVLVNQNSLTVVDSRGTSTQFSNYFIQKLYDIRMHSCV